MQWTDDIAIVRIAKRLHAALTFRGCVCEKNALKCKECLSGWKWKETADNGNET